MDSRSGYTSSRTQEKEKSSSKDTSKKFRRDCKETESSSHTQFFRKERHEGNYERITTDEYFGISESISGSSDTYHCIHGPEGKQYTEKGLLKRNFLKELDVVQQDPKWHDNCEPVYGWGMAKTLEFLVRDPMGIQQTQRLDNHLRDFAKIASAGYKIDVLDSVCTVVDYLIESLYKRPNLHEGIVLILQNMDKPIALNAASDVITHFEMLSNYLGYMGYLLMRLEGDLFDMIAKALMWQLSAPNTLRGHGTVQLHHGLAAAAPVLYDTIVRMIAVADEHKFPAFMDIALLLACDSTENCMEMMKENIIENIFYRFNPYFPHRRLPVYDINPDDLQDYNVKLGDSSVNISATLSLLLVLTKTVKHFLDENPQFRPLLPCPDYYAQRCFVWAYRYECRAREHRHQRSTLTVIATILLYIFGDRLSIFSFTLMPDVLSLSVLTELPPRSDWTRTVNFNIGQSDVQFKKILIYFSVDLLKVFQYNKFMVQYRHWLLGLLYLLDPGLSHLRSRWSPPLFAELRKTALQALVCSLPRIQPNLVKEYGLIRRVMWYIEWYSENPYELPVLYWCVRLLQVAIYSRDTSPRAVAMKNLFDTHGIIILIHLCYTLLGQKLPPVEKSQAVIALSLRIVTSAVETKRKIACCVYPNIKWPDSIHLLARHMLDVVLHSLQKHFIVSDRWLISLLNFVWEAIIWNDEYRSIFIENNGVYKLLDIITMTRPAVQCIALALVCDITSAGDSVGQLVSWRANLGASNAHPNVVHRGSTIASLLAALFKDDCRATGVRLSEGGVIEDPEFLLMSSDMQNEMFNPEFKEGFSKRTVTCIAAADLAGSRLSKVFAILHMLTHDLKYRVALADEAYNLYKHIKLAPDDEAVLVLCSHYLTVKINQAWLEAWCQNQGLVPEDQTILEEFLHIKRGWAFEIKRQQEDVLNKDRKKEHDEESSLYTFVGRARLNVALDALRDVRCVARSADRSRVAHGLLYDAVRAHHRRSVMVQKLDAPVLRTYDGGSALDDQNIIGQSVKVYSIHPKEKPSARHLPSCNRLK